MRVSHDSWSLFLLETASYLHWHSTTVISCATRRRSIAATFVANDTKGLIIVTARRSVAQEAIGPLECKLVLAAELGEGLRQHGDLVRIALPEEILVPLAPHLRLKLLRRLFLADF